MNIAYVPTPLKNMTEICQKLGVSPRQVKEWVKEGAPIIVEGKKTSTRYSAELVQLMFWRQEKQNLQLHKIDKI